MVSTRGMDYSKRQPPAPQQPAQQKPAQGGKTKRGAKTAKHTIEEDEDDIDEEEDAIDEEELDDLAASNPKRGKKRPTTDPNEGTSRKVIKTGAAGPSNRSATRSGPRTAGAASVERSPVPKKGKGKKGKGKGNEKKEAADANVSAVSCCEHASRLVEGNPCADVTRIGSNQQTVHKTILKDRNPRKSF